MRLPGRRWSRASCSRALPSSASGTPVASSGQRVHRKAGSSPPASPNVSSGSCLPGPEAATPRTAMSVYESCAEGGRGTVQRLSTSCMGKTCRPISRRTGTRTGTKRPETTARRPKGTSTRRGDWQAQTTGLGRLSYGKRRRGGWSRSAEVGEVKQAGNGRRAAAAVTSCSGSSHR